MLCAAAGHGHQGACAAPRALLEVSGVKLFHPGLPVRSCFFFNLLTFKAKANQPEPVKIVAVFLGGSGQWGLKHLRGVFPVPPGVQEQISRAW